MSATRGGIGIRRAIMVGRGERILLRQMQRRLIRAARPILGGAGVTDVEQPAGLLGQHRDEPVPIGVRAAEQFGRGGHGGQHLLRGDGFGEVSSHVSVGRRSTEDRAQRRVGALPWHPRVEDQQGWR